MGGAQSTRNISLYNDEATGVIKISDSVAQRLKSQIAQKTDGGESEDGGKPKQPSPQATPKQQPPPPPPAPTTETPSKQSPPQSQGEGGEQGHSWQRPIIQYIEEPSLSSLRVKQEKEEEMKKLEEYWQSRLQKQQEEYVTMSKMTEAEMEAGLKKVESLFTASGNKDICRSYSEAVMDCYKKYPNQPLRCRNLVQNFVSCVKTGDLPTAG